MICTGAAFCHISSGRPITSSARVGRGQQLQVAVSVVTKAAPAVTVLVRRHAQRSILMSTNPRMAGARCSFGRRTRHAGVSGGEGRPEPLASSSLPDDPL